MFRKLAIAITLCVLPTAALAQEHQHNGAAKPVEHAKVHRTLPQILIENRAELNLTEEQIAKLEALAAKMQSHHKSQMKIGAGSVGHHGPSAAKSHDKMHDELLSLFNETQKEQVKAMIRKHLEACKEGDGMHCKVERQVSKEHSKH